MNLTERLEIADIKKAKKEAAEREKMMVKALGSDCAVQAAAIARVCDRVPTEVLMDHA